MSHRMDANRFDTPAMRWAGYILGSAFLCGWGWVMWQGWGRVLTFLWSVV